MKPLLDLLYPLQRRLWRVLRPHTRGVAALSAVLLTGCTSQVEVDRATAPGEEIDAVLVEINGGATTDFAYSVRLEEAGWFGESKDVARFYAAHRSDCAYGVNLRWAGPDRLVIEYQDAEQAEAHPAKIGQRRVEVELKAGITDHAAPCGGVEYNLRGRSSG